jgi:hypothetical protein
MSLARIGIIGRAPADCELSVQAVRVAGNYIASVVGTLGVMRISASNTLQTHWLDLPANNIFSGENIGLALHASVGRFFWVMAEECPLVKLAVFEPDPAGRPLRIDGSVLIKITQPDQIHLPEHAFPEARFRSQPPVLHSSLFLTVDISDLALRYAR